MARIYGWDQSHYDGTITKAIMKKAVSQGIAFVTHKLGEGLTNVDTSAGAALSAAKAAGVKVIGGYWFIHGTNDPVAEAKRCIAVADDNVGWWREFPGWFWQCDAETSSTGLPSPSHVKAFSDELASLSGRTVIVYASHGMYGNSLKGLGHPLWNANYGSNRKGAFASVYPGDNSAGWDSYSGQKPVLLQYSSNATIAGLTTCDANAFKGTIDELLDLIGADMPLSKDDGKTVLSTDIVPNPTQRADSPGHTPPGDNPTTSVWYSLGDMWQLIYNQRDAIAALTAQVAGLVKTDTAIQATLTTLAADGTSVDTGIVSQQIKAIGDTESAQVASLQKQIGELQQQIVDLSARINAAEVASAPSPN